MGIAKDDRPLSILVIEDDLGDFLLIQDHLLEKFSSVKLVHVQSYASVLKAIPSFDTFDMVLLDLGLPDLGGEVLVEKIQERSGDIPIIILTGYSNISLARKILSKGASDFLIKDDINPEIIYKAIVYAIERRIYVNQLNRTKKVYQDLFDLSPQPMWIYDPSTLYFLDVNKAAITKYGYTLEEFKRMTLKDIRGKDQTQCLEESIAEHKRESPNNYAGNFYHTLKSGEIICVEIYSNDIEFGNRIFRLVLANDITEKQDHIETIENQNRKLRDIAWTQSHLVSAPLTRLLGSINRLEGEPEQTVDMQLLLEQIKACGNELDQIIQKIVEGTRTMDIKHLEQ